MTEQQEYYTFTKDVKTLIQYVQEQAFDHLVVEAANRLNKAIKKNVDIGLIPIKVHEGKDSFEEEKLQYAEDCKTHEKPWELWQWAPIGKNPDCEDWKQLKHAPSWWHKSKYRRKPTTLNPEYYSGLNCKDAKHLIGKVVEGTNYPNEDWKTVKLINITNGKQRSGVFEVYHQKGLGVTGTYEYIRTVEEILVPEHPTINICGVELPKPETVAPSNGEQYWLSHAGGEPGYILFWNNDDDDISALKECRIHLTKERAQAWADWWKKEIITKINEIGS